MSYLSKLGEIGPNITAVFKPSLRPLGTRVPRPWTRGKDTTLSCWHIDGDSVALHGLHAGD
jgi:hypothetical protein